MQYLDMQRLGLLTCEIFLDVVFLLCFLFTSGFESSDQTLRNLVGIFSVAE